MGVPSPKQAQVRELLKCGKDPCHFIRSYVKIQHPVKGSIPFMLFPFQEDVIRAINYVPGPPSMGHKRNVIVKARQLGISTVTAAYALWLALFHRDKNIICIATKLTTAQNFITKVKVAYNSLPHWLILKEKTGDSKQHIAFANGSQIKAVPKSADAGRSEAISFLIIDEAAHIEGFDEIWTALLPTLSEGGNVCMLSSPAGIGGIFHKTYVEALANSNNFNPIMLDWSVHPEHDEEWFFEITKGLTQKEINQEYLSEFLGSGDTYIGEDIIKSLYAMKAAPIAKEGQGGQIWIWRRPVLDHTYVMSADVARGNSTGDYSTFHIIDNTEGEVVAEFMGHIKPDEFGKLLDEWGRKYNNALMAPENNTYGDHSLTVLKHRDYPNLYYEKRLRNPSAVITDDDMAGYSNNGKNKRADLLVNMERMLRLMQIKSYSERLLHEITTFVWTGSKAEASHGMHDDLIISFAIGCRVMNVDVIDVTSKAMAYAILNSTGRSNRVYPGIAGIDKQAHSQTYADAFAILTNQLDKQETAPQQPTNPAAEKDYGVHMPSDIRRRLGGLNWLI